MVVLLLGVPVALLSSFSYLRVGISIPLLCLIYTMCILHLNRDEHDDHHHHQHQLIVYDDNSSNSSDVASEYSDSDYSYCTKLIVSYIRSITIGFKQRTILVISLILASAVIVIVSIFTTCHVCIADHPGEVSTSFSRIFLSHHSQQRCEWNSICYTYLTVPQDMSTSMIVNYHIHSEKPLTTFVEYWSIKSAVTRVEANGFRMKDIPDQQRYQYWTDLTQLQPDTKYSVRVTAKFIDGTYSTSTLQFKTGPSIDSNDEITFVTGGDIEWNNAAIQLSIAAAKTSPLFATVGGDIFYENGMPSCYQRVDSWFFNWNKYMITPDNRSVPILTAIGNHESGGWVQTRTKTAFYFRYFPHETGLQHIDPNEREAYHQHIFGGHTFIAVLDSYVVTPIRGYQTQWLSQVSSQIPDSRTNRMAVYHGSAYPVDVSDVEYVTEDLKQYFIPVFDQYRYKAVFEHHYHVFAESKMLRNGTEDTSNGIYYLGQGSWGAVYPYTIEKEPYIAQYLPIAHVYISRCSNDKCQIQGLGFDEHEGSIRTLNTITTTTITTK
jgi:hypothetical protein